MTNNREWYKDAVIYELPVRAFCDGNGDGIGDFQGLVQKLDYLQDLGVTALWLLPFYPSPLKDDGYDISDYFGVHKDYGTLADFKRFLKEAKRRGLRVITELVLNHTSDQHELFQKARRAPPGSPERDFYVWSDDPGKYSEARVIFQDFETSNWAWDPVAKAYYWHRFYSHQPDLNFDNPAVRAYILRVLDFWLGLGVDGLRLDAVPYLFEREGTNCENLPETHEFLRELRRHVDAKFKDRMLLAEANQWPEDAAIYFGDGDECHAAFHFPLMPRLFMALQMEDCSPIVDILQQTPDVSGRGQWAIFLRNHDELTLEMVTDEERDYMYRFYAQDARARINLGIRRRLAPLLGNHRRKIELLNSLLLSLPGTPVLYYGDEIGMGDNIHLGDRNGVRTPMLWNADRNAGFSRANAQSLYLPIIIEPEYHYEAVNVEVQQNNQHSLFWWMKRAIDMRKRYKAFGRGTMEFVGCENRKIFAYVRAYEGERILAVANLSRFVQLAELDLSPFKGLALVEMFGRFEFPPVTDERYRLTLAPHSFYWFRLRQPTAAEVNPALAPAQTPVLAVSGGAEAIFSAANAAALGEVLQSHLRARQWFEGQQHLLRAVRILDDVPLTRDNTPAARLCLVQTDFLNAPPEVYLLPLATSEGEKAAKIRREYPFSVLAEVRVKNGKGGGCVLFDAAADPEFCADVLAGVRQGRRLKGRSGDVIMTATEALAAALDDKALPDPVPFKGSRRSASTLFGDRVVLKFFRRLHEGENPDAEISRYLSQAKGFAYSPALAGEISYRPRQGTPRTLAVLHCYVPNRGDAWQYTLDALRRYFDDLPGGLEFPKDATLTSKFWTLAEAPSLALERVGAYLETAKLLGRRTAELHRALADGSGGKAFAPENFGELYQRSLYQSLRNRAKEAFYLLRRRAAALPAYRQEEAAAALALENETLARLRGLLGRKLSGRRIRCHGDYHLKQVLYTGSDFQIFDFEGPAGQPLEERRIKRSPLHDTAGMLRSFDYAVYAVLLGRVGVSREADVARLELWAQFWSQWVSASFWRSYMAAMEGSGLLPKIHAETDTFLEILLIERALDEVRQELDSSPEWAVIPLTGFLRLLGPQGARSATRSAA